MRVDSGQERGGQDRGESLDRVGRPEMEAGTVGLVLHADGAGSTLVVPGGSFLLVADFVRQGGDLLLVGPDGHQVLITGYFAADPPPALVTEGGAIVPPDLVAALAGPLAPGQYAQTEGGLEAVPIGRVTEAAGEVTATRVDGSVVTLTVDTLVFQGDVLETGPDAAISIAFVDETVFSLGESGRMVLDELIFDPTSLEGNSTFSVLQGVFVFVSGEIASNNPDEMIVRTPVATIGVRGTNVAGQAAQEGQLNTAVLLPALAGLQGSSGAITYQTHGGKLDGVDPLVLTEAYQAASAASVFDAPTQFEISPADLAGVLAQVLRALPGTALIQDIRDTVGDGEASGGGPSAESLAQIAPAAAIAESGLGEAVFDPEFDGILGGFDDALVGGTLGDLLGPVPEFGAVGAGPTGPRSSDDDDVVIVAPPPPGIVIDFDIPGGIDTPIVIGVGQSFTTPLDGINRGDFIRQNAGDADAVRVELLGGVQYTASLKGDAFGAPDNAPGTAGFGGSHDDPFLIVMDGVGNVLAQDDDGGLNTNALIDFTPAADGSFFLQATPFSGENLPGDVTISIEESFVVVNGQFNVPFDGDAAGATDNDVIHLRHTQGINLVVANPDWSNIEKLDMASGSTSNSILIDADFVTRITDASNTLGIGLAINDSVILGNGWSPGGINGDNFHVFTGPGGQTIFVRAIGRIDVGFTAGNDVFLGSPNGDRIQGLGGNDFLVAGVALASIFPSDVLLGGDGNDTLIALGGASNELFGEAGNDTLDASGSFGDNELVGGDGDDVLIGGLGVDLLDGGLGNDTLQGTVTTVATYENAIDIVDVDLLAGTAAVDGVVEDTLIDIRNVIGSPFGDTIRGGDADDVLDGLDGDDEIDGRGGNDVLIAGPGDDDFIGGDGFDLIDYSFAAEGITVDLDIGEAIDDGDGGSDLLNGIEDVIGSDNADDITGNDDGNFIAGGGGSDEISGLGGGDFINGDDGDDEIDGGDGNDDISGDDGNDVIFGGASDDTLFGVDGNDELDGEDGDDILLGGFGDDDLDGGPGNDTADYSDPFFFLGPITVDLAEGFSNGAAGNDTLVEIENVIGGDSADTLIGDAENNRLEGRDGDDTLVGDDGDDILDGGLGLDAVDYFDANGSVDVDLSLGRTDDDGNEDFDTLISIEIVLGSNGFGDTIVGDDGNNGLSGFGGDDILRGGAGDDQLNGGDDDDEIDGGDGFDIASYNTDGAQIVANLLDGTVSQEDGEFEDILISIEGISGSPFDDIIDGDNGFNILFGDAGADEIDGLGGNDILFGDAGDDLIVGGDGDDSLDGGVGADELDGGDGIDTVTYAAAAATVLVNLANNSEFTQGDQLFNVENVVGSLFDDVLTGDVGSNRLEGNDGFDTLFGGAGDDILDGGDGLDLADYSPAQAAVVVDLAAGTTVGAATGNDTLIDIEDVLGSFFADVITGDGGNNSLQAFDGNDVVSGAGGNDFLVGGVGNDTLNGDAGSDFILGSPGDDILNGGAGDDFLADDDPVDGGGGADVFNGGAGDDEILLLPDNADDVINGGAGFDLLDLSAGQNLLVDLAAGTVTGLNFGNDTVSGIEEIEGGILADTIRGDALTNAFFGNEGDDLLDGRGGADLLEGDEGNDILLGGAGNDILLGGAGNDVQTGGAGSDIFAVLSFGDGLFNGNGVIGGPFNQITDFAPGTDSLFLANNALGFGNFEGTVPEANFAVVPNYNGLNSGIRALDTHVVFDPINGTVSVDLDSGADGYTTFFTVQPGVNVTAANIDIGAPVLDV